MIATAADCIYFNFKNISKWYIFMVFRMNEISIDDEIKEIIDETSKWTKLFESFWNVFWQKFYDGYDMQHIIYCIAYTSVENFIFANTGKSFKSKFIIEKQQNLLKKLHYENNILKNEASQLKSTNSRLVTKLRSRWILKFIAHHFKSDKFSSPNIFSLDFNLTRAQ